MPLTNWVQSIISSLLNIQVMCTQSHERCCNDLQHNKHMLQNMFTFLEEYTQITEATMNTAEGSLCDCPCTQEQAKKGYHNHNSKYSNDPELFLDCSHSDCLD